MEKWQSCYSSQTGGLNHEKVSNSNSLFFHFRLKQNRASLQQAQAMARHGSSETTLVYFHNLQRIEAGAERHIDF